MTTLVDRQIIHWANGGGVTPFDRSLVNPASLNVRVGNYLRVESPGGEMYEVDISDCSIGRPFLVDPGEFILAQTQEKIRILANMEAEVCLRSSAARAGWDHHLAGYIDPGWDGVITLEFKNNRRFAALPIYPGLELCQLRIRRLDREPERHYGITGRYQGDTQVNGCQDPTIGG